MKKVNIYSKKPGSGPLNYAMKGQTFVRPQAHGGKAKMSKSTGSYFAGGNKSSVKG